MRVARDILEAAEAEVRPPPFPRARRVLGDARCRGCALCEPRHLGANLSAVAARPARRVRRSAAAASS
jgi:hypothetical protein